MRGRIAIGLLLAGLCCPPAEARSGVTWSYPQDEIYSTAVRFLRIDRGCSITDRDAQAAYLIFECKDGKQVKHGALELFQQSDGVRVQVSLSDEPSYMEQRFLELLGRKLREERGPPAARPSPRDPDGGSR